ncbi:hypothetical protein INT45_000440 [Circinella minor]|uniref:Uncharacterized protein n=1 Tax=Circinella minor TaxID=1195481 RepID=A0A8H7VIR8_9FUNG|nr:hypothetical protein INT45_000440 [Circinella minor]
MSSSSSDYSYNSLSYTNLYLFHENYHDWDEEENVNSPQQRDAVTMDIKTELTDTDKEYQPNDKAHLLGPRVVENIDGIISY